MDELMPFLTWAVPFAALGWLLHRRFGRQENHHPLWPAFNATAGAAALMLAGITGYNLNALDAVAAGTPWSGWRKGLRAPIPDTRRY